ncbi:MAG: MFS transporter, partial [Chloroflexi bacterium]|nr:MFS transporter [Chloroflexota bacterium]
AVWRLAQRERISDRYRAAMGAKPGWTAVRSTLGRKELWLLGGGFMGGAGAYFTALTFLPFYLTQERGMPLTSAGAIVSMLPLGGLAAALTTGFLSDRLGRRKPFVWTAGLALPALYWIMLSPVPEVTLPFIAFVLGYFAWAPFGIINTMPFELPGLTPQQVAMGQSLVQTIGPIAFALICLLLPETGPAARKV